MTERIVGTEEISEERIGTSDFIGIKVSDTCMAPRIFPGDIAIIRRQQQFIEEILRVLEDESQ